MSHDLEQAPENQPQPHHHSCGNLFGCGDEKGTGVFREDIKDSAFTNRAADHLLHIDEIDQAQFDGCLTARGRSRRKLLRASSFMGALAAIGPWFTKLAYAADLAESSAAATAEAPLAQKRKEDEGHVHVVESNE